MPEDKFEVGFSPDFLDEQGVSSSPILAFLYSKVNLASHTSFSRSAARNTIRNN